MLPVYLVAVPKIESSGLVSFRVQAGAFMLAPQWADTKADWGVLARLQSSLPSELIGGALEIMEWRDPRSWATNPRISPVCRTLNFFILRQR